MQSGLKYKRNQVDEAIAAVLRRDRDGAPQHVRTRIKRLLDLDRVLGREGELRIRCGVSLHFMETRRQGRALK